MYIVMGQTESRVFEKYSWAMTEAQADRMVWVLNLAYRQSGVPIRFYMTQILDV
ncbi:hypothetical protein D3C86_812510 [compost metagenome]